MKTNVTEAQARAINFDGGNVLVSASAGSGKTFVMISRVVGLVLSGKANVNEILCVTFTSKAAGEMKQKLLSALNSEIEKSANDEQKVQRLYKQLELLPSADISTVHAFCKNLLTEFFYRAGLDSAFSVADDKESELLVNRAIDRLFDDLYEKNDERLKLLVPLYFKKRSDKELKERVVKIYNVLIAERSPEQILNDGEFYYTPEGVKHVISGVVNECVEIAARLNAKIKEISRDINPSSKYYKFSTELSVMLGNFTPNADYAKICHSAKSADFTYPRESKKDPDVEELRAFYYGSFKPFLESLEKLLGESEEEELLRAERLRPVYNALSSLVKSFSEYYAREKREENVVDFSDLEHLTLKLLEDEQIREEVVSRYKYVFADEYQDTNGVQEALLNLVSRGNLFMVGDVKQSIYNFRGCNPDIFADKFDNYVQNPDLGTALSLDKNFRSSRPIINAVNGVFSAVMTKRFGRIDYKNNPMTFGGGYPDDEGEVRGVFIKPDKGEKSLPNGVYGVTKHLEVKKEAAGFAEGRLAADLISGVVGQTMFDVKSGSFRKIGFGDCAVLLRSTKDTGDKFVNELIKAGVPVAASSRKSIGKYPEIAFLTDFLRLIGCFNQDIPLVSVLKSPIGNLSEPELLKIRTEFPALSFCEAYRAYLSEKTDDIGVKLRAFDEYIKKIRLLSAFMPCDELLETVVREKGLDVEFLSSRLGEQKLARVNLFIDAVGAKKRTVQEFLPLMEKTVEGLSLEYSNENAVKIMSIHASKGLEFPVVILGCSNKKYKTDDLSTDMIIDKKYGVALKLNDGTDGIVKETLFRKYVRFKKLIVMREEEARLLYVALTRAKNRLFITGTTGIKKGGVVLPIKSAHGPEDGLFSSSYCDLFAECDFNIKISDEEDFTALKKTEARRVLAGAASEELKNKIKRNLSFEYPFIADEKISVKCSVTAAARFEEEDSHPFEYAPIFGETDDKIGSAYHKYLQLCDFSVPPESAVNGLIASRLMSKEEAELLSLPKLNAILQMPVFKELSGFELYKEQPFTALLPASYVERDYSGKEQILVQGIIDLLAVRGDQAVIVDYKFSALKNDEDLVLRYEKQLRLYALAVEKVLKKKIVGLYIANIYSCRLIELPL